MARMLLQYLIPLLLPTALYLGWRFLRVKGKEGEDAEDVPVPWLWLVGTGVALLLLTLFVTAQTQGVPAGADYTAPYLREDGTVAPGEFK